MYFLKTLLSLSVAVATMNAVTAKVDIWARLDKPAVRKDFTGFEPLLIANLPETKYNISVWARGWIPSDCNGYADSHNVSAADFIIYQVQYNDCGDPWIMCYHKDSEASIENIAKQFGRIPIQMREWVKHVVTIPDKMGWAYMDKGNTVFMRPTDSMVTTMIHETAHAVDLNGGYGGSLLSGSALWAGNYAQDTHVPDDYSATDTVEDIAQSTVVAVLNENVQGPNGGSRPSSPTGRRFPSNMTLINGLPFLAHSQYATITTQARNYGRGNSMLVPGENVACAHRLPNSSPVAINTVARVFGRSRPDVRLSRRVKVIRALSQHLGPTNCTIHW
ncbi:hypothetical protein PG997_006931 [Apiospora hydei]|uniref:Conidiation-specific protein n=1 Tax=Apiospora hydei TaxID=1337664 RepID=A0ABR1WQ51_9PEZI